MIDVMIERIIKFLDDLFPMSEPLKDALRKNLSYKKNSKGDIMLREGQVSTNIYFIAKGLVRIYIINDEGEEINIWFMMEKDVMVGPDSFFDQKPGELFIEALQETEVLYISHECLYRLYREFPEFLNHRAILNEKYYKQSHGREIAFKKHNAEGRYQYLLENHPELVKKLGGNLLCSYIDMSPSTYSKVRAKYGS